MKKKQTTAVAEEKCGNGSEAVKEAEGENETKKKPQSRQKPKSTKRLLVELIVKIGVIAAAIWALFTFVLGITVHYGNNMHPAVRDGDLAISLRVQRPGINAVVLYDIDGKTNIGRIVAFEGDVIDITENGELRINDSVPSEEVFYPTFKAEASKIEFPYTVEAGKVFILNDFRADTYDSRTFGAVDRKDVKGPLLLTMRRRDF